MTEVLINMGDQGYSKKDSIVNDFMYGTNVAQANIYIRMGFLRKVYGILSAQLLLTVILTSLAMFIPVVRFYINENEHIVLLGFIMSMVVLIGLIIKRKETPTNYILLLIFTCAESYTVAVVASFYDQMAVLQAAILTFCVTFALTLYTFQSKRDFSTWGAGLFSFLWIIVMAGILQIYIQSTQLEFLMSIGGAVLFSLFIIYDTHNILHHLSPEEYIVAAIDLYLNIINLFLYILRIIGSAKKH